MRRYTAEQMIDISVGGHQEILADRAAQLESLVLDQPMNHWLPVWEQLRSGISHAYVMDSDGA